MFFTYIFLSLPFVFIFQWVRDSRNKVMKKGGWGSTI
jgi:hypothetical protein